MKNIDTFYPTSRLAWRTWLQENYHRTQAIWLLFYKKNSKKPSLSWEDAVEEALCFGWIDSTRQPIDEEKFRQYFCKRKPNSTWSKINKEKVDKLIRDKKMTAAGLEIIAIAKSNGAWTFLDDVEALVVPKDLQEAFLNSPEAQKFYKTLSKSIKKRILFLLAQAKREETRAKRIHEIITKGAQQKLPKGF